MDTDKLIQDLQKLKEESKQYSNNTSINESYRVAIMDAIDLVKNNDLLHNVSQQRKLLEAYSDKLCGDLGLDFDNQDEYINKFLASNCT